jgi:hypothetical protein
MPAPTYRVDERYKQYATESQAKYLDAINEHKSMGAAAAALGVNPSTVRGALEQVKKKAAIFGFSPEHDMVRPVPETHVAKGISTYYNKDGKPTAQWVKSSLIDAKREEVVRESLKALAESVAGLSPVIPGPEHSEADLAAVIPVGDPHFGLYVWAQECGQDFDTDIARKLSIAAVDRLVSSAPACSVGVLLLLGDILHANDQTNQTPAHKHQLDVDTRFVRVVKVTVETWRHAIHRMKERFGKVVVKLLPGNHDPTAVWALAYALHAYFSSDPAVEVDLGPSKFWYYEFGNVLIGSTHGDTVKPERLPGIMAADRHAEWGRTKFRYWYTGHIHSKNAIEFPGCQWESFRTLAPADSYAASHGYRSGRDMVLIVQHREFGEVERHRVDVGMLA